MPSNNKKRSSARTTVKTIPKETRDLIGNAIVKGLISPKNFTFTTPLASEGGDYDQDGGNYTQIGSGSHDQGGSGNYNQSPLTSGIDDFQSLDVTNILDVVKKIDKE